MEPGSPLQSELRELVVRHPEAAGYQEKWELYRRASELLSGSLHLIDRGCWDYFDDDARAGKDYKMWTDGMVTLEGARAQPSGSMNPYRSEGRYLTFTMSFL